jgi:hypothetical protein
MIDSTWFVVIFMSTLIGVGWLMPEIWVRMTKESRMKCMNCRKTVEQIEIPWNIPKPRGTAFAWVHSETLVSKCHPNRFWDHRLAILDISTLDDKPREKEGSAQ